jgi:hypothetical protein
MTFNGYLDAVNDDIYSQKGFCKIVRHL